MEGDFACSFCGEDRGVAAERLAVTQSGWDRLSVMRWMPDHGTYALMACCPDHARQLVNRWALTGDLLTPFARAVLGERRSEPIGIFHNPADSEPICEFAVDREGIERLLTENPQFLDTMLNALYEAVGGESQARLLGDEELVQTSGAMAAD